MSVFCNSTSYQFALMKKIVFDVFCIQTPVSSSSGKRTEYGGTSKKFCKEKDIQVHSTRNQTKAASAEKAIQSLKCKIYRYSENHGQKIVPKLEKNVSITNCRKNQSPGKFPRDAKNNDFVSILMEIEFFSQE